MRFLKQSTDVTIKLGPFVDDTDGKTAETALTISQTDVRLSKNGGNMVAKNEVTAAVHDEIGMYDCELDTTDTNTLGILTINVHEAGALPVKQEYMVVPANVYDAFVLGTALLNTNVTQVSGDAVAADNLEAAHDGTGYAHTGNTYPWTPAWGTEVQNEVNDALVVNHLDHLLAVAYDPTSKPGAADALLNVLVESDAGVPRYTANALEQAPTGAGGDGSAFTNIPWNAAWDAEVQSEVQDGLSAYTAPTTVYLDGRSLPSADYATATQATAIEADTQDLQARVPATLENGRMRVKVEQIADVVVTVGGTGGQSIGGA